MSQSTWQLKTAAFWFSIFFSVYAGCATQQPKIPAEEKPEIPVEQIREKADKAFDELRVEEGQQKALPGRTKRESKERSSGGEPKEAFQVTKGKRPDWVDGESVRYPSSRYLVGVGYGSDRQSAEENARSEIARVFSSEIDSQIKIYEEYLRTTSKGGADQTGSITIEQISRVSTKKVLSGVKISQVYQEAKPDPIFYALAVLDRSQSAAILRHKIQELDQGIQRLLTNASGEQDKLIKIKYLKESAEKHILRQAYDTELRIVSRSGGGIPLPIRFSEIKGRLERILLRDFLIGLSVTGTRAEEILEALVQGINQQGFSVCDDLGRADVLVRGTIEIEPFDRGTPEWKYVQWRAHFDLVDQRGGTVFGSVNKRGREGHRSHVQAEDRAVREIRKALTTHIAEEMTQYIFSQQGN